MLLLLRRGYIGTLGSVTLLLDDAEVWRVHGNILSLGVVNRLAIGRVVL
jgi:hypothetical protein